MKISNFEGAYATLYAADNTIVASSNNHYVIGKNAAERYRDESSDFLERLQQKKPFFGKEVNHVETTCHQLWNTRAIWFYR